MVLNESRATRRVVDGTVLMHTTMGDLLRRLECEELATAASSPSTPLPSSHQLPPITQIVLNRDCAVIIIYGHTTIATLTTSGRPLSRAIAMTGGERVLCTSLSRDGEYLVVGTDHGCIHIFKVFPMHRVYSFPKTDSAIRCVAVSTNQRMVLGGLDSGGVVVFNADFTRFHHSYKRRY